MKPITRTFDDTAAEGPQLRSLYETFDDGEQMDTGAAERFIFTSVRAEATGPVFIVSEVIRCPRIESQPLQVDRIGLRKSPENRDAVQRSHGDHASPLPSISSLLSAAQQYLQALRECISPPRELCEAWEAFYEACDPLVRRTVAACGINGANAADSVQEAWLEITAKLTRLEYDPKRGPLEAWLRIVVHRTACRHARRDHRQTAGRIDTDLSALTCPRILGPATATQRAELRASVREALAAFRSRVSSTAYRILVMAVVHDETSTEIGKRLGLSPGNVRVTRHRTAEKFRQFVAGQSDLADVFELSALPDALGKTRKNQRPDEFAETSKNSADPL